MWWILSTSMAWADAVTVEVVREVPLDPHEVIASFSDLQVASTLLDGHCTRDWALGAPAEGQGARARTTYTMPFMRRRLTVVVDEVTNRRVVWDHLGRSGFYTYVEAVPSAVGSEVRMWTSVNPPPWPMVGVFRQKVLPAWQACYATALDRLAGEAPSEPVADNP